MTDPQLLTVECVFVPPNEPFMCSVHTGGYRAALDETVCRAAQAEAVQPLTPAEVEEFDRWAASRKGKGVSLGMLWALRLRATLAAADALTGDDLRAAIAAASPLINPRLSEVEWDDVAARLTAAEESRP